jgi:hypothetical protein
MGRMLVSLTEETEKLLREYAQERYGKKKGSLSLIIEEALRRFFREEDKKLLLQKAEEDGQTLKELAQKAGL